MKEKLKNSMHLLLALLFGLFFIVFSAANRRTNYYTLQWITDNSLYLTAALVCVIPTVLKKWKFGLSIFLGTMLGLIFAELFGPDPNGVTFGSGHNGWAIWLCVFVASFVCGILLEIFTSKRKNA